MSIADALDHVSTQVRKASSKPVMVAITGPGDPLATPEITFEILTLLKEKFPDVSIGLLTFGIGSGRLAGDLAAAGVGYVEMKVAAVRRDILEKLFAWIRPGQKTVKLADGSALLLKEQRQGVSALTFHNVRVSVLTTLYPGYNIDHVAKISSEMVELGATSMALVPYSQEPGAEVELESPDAATVAAAQARVSTHLPVSPPLLYQQGGSAKGDSVPEKSLPAPSRKRPNVAVVSSNGMDVDLHLGHAIRFLIYGPRNDGLACLLATRPAPEPGSGTDRWKQVADTLDDCFILLTASAGDCPRTVLAENGLQVFVTEDNIEGMVDALYGGGKKKK